MQQYILLNNTIIFFHDTGTLGFDLGLVWLVWGFFVVCLGVVVFVFVFFFAMC